MDKLALLLTGVAVVIACVIMMPNEVLMVADALYAIPPTPAWQTIIIDNNQTVPTNSEISIQARNSSDTLAIVSDGSILINITQFTP